METVPVICTRVYRTGTFESLIKVRPTVSAECSTHLPLWQTKRQSEIHLVFFLFNDAPSIYWTLTVCSARIRWSQSSYIPNSPHAFPTVYHSVTKTAVFNSACATRRLQKLLTIDGIYWFYFVLFYLTVFYLWCIFLSVFNSVAVKSFFIPFQPLLSYFIFSFFLLFVFPSYCTHFIFFQLLTHTPSNNRRSNGFITSFSICSEGTYNSDNSRKWCNMPFS